MRMQNGCAMRCMTARAVEHICNSTYVARTHTRACTGTIAHAQRPHHFGDKH